MKLLFLLNNSTEYHRNFLLINTMIYNFFQARTKTLKLLPPKAYPLKSMRAQVYQGSE